MAEEGDIQRYNDAICQLYVRARYGDCCIMFDGYEQGLNRPRAPDDYFW